MVWLVLGISAVAMLLLIAQAPTVFPLDAELVLEYLAEITPELAEKKAKEFGFNRFTGDWMDIVQDPNVDVVDICTPNFLHKENSISSHC